MLDLQCCCLQLHQESLIQTTSQSLHLSDNFRRISRVQFFCVSDSVPFLWTVNHNQQQQNFQQPCCRCRGRHPELSGQRPEASRFTAMHAPLRSREFDKRGEMQMRKTKQRLFVSAVFKHRPLNCSGTRRK